MVRRVGRQLMGLSPLLPPPRGLSASWPTVIAAAADDAMAGDVAARACSSWITEDFLRGASHRALASDFARVDFDAVVECRRPLSRKGMGNFVGRQAIPLVDGYSPVWFESFNEQSHLMDLVITGEVSRVVAQPCRLEWSFQQGMRWHVPDFAVELGSGRRLLVDVTTAAKLLRPEVFAIFALTAVTSCVMGWDYQVRSELPAQRARNLRFLWPYLVEAQEWPVETRGTVSTPCTVRQATAALGGGPTGLSAVWRAIALGRLFLDLDRPIDFDTVLSDACEEVVPAWLQMM